MAFMMMKKKKYKFSVECCLEKLVDVPFVAGVLFAKVRLLDGGNYQQHSNRIEVNNHTVVWNTPISFECKMTANASNGVLETCNLRISVRKECKGGRSYQKLGFVDINLAEFAGAGETAHCYLLEGYDTRCRQDNSTIKLRIRMNMLSGDPLFKVPALSLKHKQLSEHLGEVDTVLPENDVIDGKNGNPPSGTPEQQQPPNPPLALTNQSDNRDDCGSSIASGSSGFGSLPKKRPTLVSNEFLNNQNNLVSSESEAAETDQNLVSLRNAVNDNIPIIRGEESDGGTVGTLQRQRSGSDMLERCVLSTVSNQCPHCLQGNTHSRNSSNTSGEMSSKISGYGSSLSQQSQHSRQSSEGGDSSEGGRHQQGASSTLIRRFPPKLYIERNRQIKASSPGGNVSDNSDAFLTPNSTLSDMSPQGDLLIRSADTPLSPVNETLFHTPNSTMLSPMSANQDSNHHLPSYFDRRKQDIISLAKSAANVLPLHNFQLFKQKSLNTIPDLIESRSAKERKESESEFFHNFPFLTPLSHRKNSIHDKTRLSSCNEDDFYLTSDYDFDARYPLRSAGFCEGKTFANLISQPHNKIPDNLAMSFMHSTPKGDQIKSNVYGKTAHNMKRNETGAGHELCTSKSGIITSNLENPFNSVNPLRHSYTTHCMAADIRLPNIPKRDFQQKPELRDTWCRQCGVGATQQQECDSLPPTLKHRRPSTTALNNSGGLMTETGSLDRGKAALERRKPKSIGPYGTIGGSTTGSDPDPPTGHLVSGRVENTRVNPDSLIDELLKSTNLEQAADSAEISGLQLYIAQDGTTALGSRQIKSQMTQGRKAYKQVVMEDIDNR